MAEDAQVNNYVSRVRNAAEEFINLYNRMAGLRDEYAKLGLSSEIIQVELSGLNDEVTGGEITAVMTSIDALKVYFDSGHGTNMYRVKP